MGGGVVCGRIAAFCLVMSGAPAVGADFFPTQTSPLSFDKLFPQSPISIVLDSCMRIQHELLWHATRDHIDEAEAEDLVDRVVGRLYHVQECAHDIVTGHLCMQEEDMTYVFSLLETITQTYQTLLQKRLPAHGKNALALITDIKKTLAQLVG